MSYSPVFYKEIILYFFLLLAWLAILAYIYLFLFFFPLCCILFIQIITPTQNTTFSPKKLKTASEDNSASNKSNGFSISLTKQMEAKLLFLNVKLKSLKTNRVLHLKLN